MSVTSSQKALSHCSGIRKRNAQLRTNIVDALNDNKPRWVTKNYPAESNMIVNQQYNAYGVSPFPKRNLRNNPVYREIGLDKLVGSDMYTTLP